MTISEDKIQEFKEAFSLFDRSGEGCIFSRDVGDLLRVLGQNPTNAEIKKLVGADDDGNRRVLFEEFLQILQRPGGFEPRGTIEEAIKGFRVFDKENNGQISAGELRYVLTTLGEPLTSEEVDEIFKLVPIEKNGMIQYEEFVRTIMSS